MAEVLIVGGGVIGLAIARELHKKGVREIALLERGQIGEESSYAAAGMLAPSAETVEINDFFRLCSESNDLYPRLAEELFDETGVDIELDRSGTLYLAFNETDLTEIQRRFERQRENLPVEFLSATEIKQIEPFVSPDVQAGLFYPRDWQVENRNLLAALRRYAEINDIRLIENSPIENLLIENGKIKGAETKTAEFAAKTIVLATGAWTSLIKTGATAPLSDLPIKPIRGQMIVFQTAKRLFQRVIYSPRGYIVPRRNGRILAGATVEDVGFDKSVTAEGIEFLRENALQIAPGLMNLEISEQWAGLRPSAADGLPILGAFPEIENLFLATAHFRNGILLAPLTAQIIAGKIAADSESKYLEIFSPRRFYTAKAMRQNKF